MSLDLWHPNSPDVKLVYYQMWATMQERVYLTDIHVIDELKLWLIQF